MLGQEATADRLAALREELGLDVPHWQQYFGWVGGMFSGDLGRSYTEQSEVSELVATRLLVTVPMAVSAMVVAIIIAVPLGVLSASRHRSIADTAISCAAQLGVALPAFWLGLLLVIIFSVQLGWLPAGGFVHFSTDPGGFLRSLTLPALALGIGEGAILTRFIRSTLLDVLQEDYIRTARAKGLTRNGAMWRHGLKNAALPVVTMLGLHLAFLLAGAIVIETVFFLPGVGRMVIQATYARDLVLLRGTIMVIAGAVLLINFATDIAYQFLDPRLRLERDANK